MPAGMRMFATVGIAGFRWVWLMIGLGHGSFCRGGSVMADVSHVFNSAHSVIRDAIGASDPGDGLDASYSAVEPDDVPSGQSSVSNASVGQLG